MNPVVSVLLPVYNCESYISDAVESILNQTFSDFELIILNDGSTDKSEEVISRFNDKRIRYIKHENIGLAATLNKGIELSNGVYIARQDADDISIENRFQLQVDFLNNNPQVVLVGTWAEIRDVDNKLLGYHKHSTTDQAIKLDLLFDNPFVHSSVMFRKEALEKTGLYSTDRSLFEDYYLWSKFSSIGKVANLNKCLLVYKHHESGISKGTVYYKENAVINQSLQNISSILKEESKEIKNLVNLYHWNYNALIDFNFHDIIIALNKVKRYFITNGMYSEEIHNRFLQYKKVLRYRYNLLLRKKYKNKLALACLVAEVKLLGLYPNIKNN